ncbi:uncharacterized protein V6R79_007365 [Siganus canaliculatus]
MCSFFCLVLSDWMLMFQIYVIGGRGHPAFRLKHEAKLLNQTETVNGNAHATRRKVTIRFIGDKGRRITLSGGRLNVTFSSEHSESLTP